MDGYEWSGILEVAAHCSMSLLELGTEKGEGIAN